VKENLMDIEPKDGLTYLSFAASVGGIWMWVKGQFKSGRAREVVIKERVLDIETRFEKRVEDIESRFTTPNNEPALMTYRAHDHICLQAHRTMVSEFKHVVDALDSNSEQLKEIGGKIGDMSVLVAVLKGKVEREEKRGV